MAAAETTQFGCYILIRFDSDQLPVVEVYLATDEALETQQGRLEACTDQVHYVEGKTWSASKSICAVYFPDRSLAHKWFEKFQSGVNIVKVDAFIIDLISFPPEGLTSFSLAILDLRDEHRFFTEYCRAFGPPFREAGGKVGASREVVTRTWEALMGDWIPGDRRILLNYLPSVAAALRFFLSERYKEAQASRNAYSDVDLYVFERRV